MTALAPMFARVEPRLQASKYVRAVMSDLPKRNGWTIAEWIGDRSPDATRRLLNRARWDTAGAMGAVRLRGLRRLHEAPHLPGGAGPGLRAARPRLLRPHPRRRHLPDLRAGGGRAPEAEKRRWTVHSAGDGSKGDRTYARAWIATTAATHFLPVRRHRSTGGLAFHYCFVPEGRPAALSLLIAAAGLR
ncbi:hypothetical protein SAMN05421505_10336 [Sinosporangium album]|uniref:DDE superfamily endonuclease n=1 Tax=Sinosporangium album TaxID=504805 RepID=A0A1G7T1E2_9ACTN|nr:hypothetical protein [Sinosporangium album]SDG28469.1 hypothetical protein SAMN05421505_10336 [Sinosporangium album]